MVIGAGPAGTLAAYFLAEEGYRPLVLERGRAVRERIRDMRAFEAGGPHQPESNYLFGEGGAGTFSDGKLTCRASGPDVRRVLELFAECKGKPSILYDYRPHLGSNRLPAVVKALRQRIEAARRRVALRVPGRGSRPGRRPGARAGNVVGLYRRAGRGAGHRPQRPRHVRNAARPRRADGRQAVSDGRAHRAAAGRSSTACNTARPGWKTGWARPTTAWWHAAAPTCSPSACAPAAKSCPASPSQAFLPPTA